MADRAAELGLPDVVVGDSGGISTLYLPSTSTTHHVMLAFRVGRADEQLASAGITHLVEHLAFAPTATGATRSNGYVNDTMTAFMTRGNESEVREFVSDICAALASPPTERLEHEQRVIATEESSQGMFPPWGMLPMRFGARTWGTLGFAQYGLDRLQPDDIREWAYHWFCRGNAVICHNGPEPIEFAVDPLPAGLRRAMPVPMTIPDLAFPSYAGSGSPHVVVSMECERRAGSGMTLRLLRTAAEQRLRHGLGLSYSVNDFSTSTGDGKALSFLFADALPEHAGDVSNGLWGVLTRIAEAGPTYDELRHEQDLLRRMLRDSEAHPALLPYLAGEVLAGVPVNEALDSVEAPLSLEPDAVQEIAQEYRASALFAGPAGSAPSDAELHPYPYVAELSVTGEVVPQRSFQMLGELILGEDGVALVFADGALNARFEDCEAVLRWRNGDIIVVTSAADRIWILDRHYHDVKRVRDVLAWAVPAERFVDFPGDECPSEPPGRADLRPAPVLQRVHAAVIDTLLAGCIFIGAVLASSAVVHALTGWNRDVHEDAYTGVAFGAWFVGTWLFFALFESRRGATPGKQARLLLVVGEDRQPLSFLRASARFAMATLSIVIAGIGILMIPFSRKRHGLHDIVTRTEVMQRIRPH